MLWLSAPGVAEGSAREAFAVEVVAVLDRLTRVQADVHLLVECHVWSIALVM
jgi:hypothetical protein